MSNAKRNPVNFRFDLLDPDFLKAMGEIAHYGAEKYGEFNYAKSRLQGSGAPLNHIIDHALAYSKGEKHDYFHTLEHQLAAVAFNAMMEFYYLRKFGKVDYPVAGADGASSPVHQRRNPMKYDPKTVFPEAYARVYPFVSGIAIQEKKSGATIATSSSFHAAGEIVDTLNGGRSDFSWRAVVGTWHEKYAIFRERPPLGAASLEPIIVFDDDRYPGEAEPSRTRAECLAQMINGEEDRKERDASSAG